MYEAISVFAHSHLKGDLGCLNEILAAVLDGPERYLVFAGVECAVAPVAAVACQNLHHRVGIQFQAVCSPSSRSCECRSSIAIWTVPENPRNFSARLLMIFSQYTFNDGYCMVRSE